MKTIKVSVISKDISLCEKIKHSLENLEVFEVDYMDNIKKCIARYDVIIIDMDCFEQVSEKWILQLVKRFSKSKRFVLLKEVYKIDCFNVSILPKPITEMSLVDSICDVMLRDLHDVIEGNSLNRELINIKEDY